MTRTEEYIQTILSRPNQWVRIKKRKAHNVSKTTKTHERDETIQDIKTALNVMGVKYQQLNGTKIRMIEEVPLPFDSGLPSYRQTGKTWTTMALKFGRAGLQFSDNVSLSMALDELG